MPALDAPKNPETADSGTALWASLAGLLQGSASEALPALPAARGGDGLPDGGKDLPPMPAAMLPAGGLPGMPRELSVATDDAAGLPVGDAAEFAAAAPREDAVASAEPPGASVAANPAPPFPFPEAPDASPVPTVGMSPAGLHQAALLPPERTAPAAGQAEVRHPPVPPNGDAGDESLAALTRRIPHPAIDPTGDLRHDADLPVIRPAPGDRQDTRRASPDARYAAPPLAMRAQTDIPIVPMAPEAIEALDGKLAAAAGSVTLSANGASPAPLSTTPVVTAQPATGGQAPVPPAATAMPAVMPSIDVPPGANGWGDALGDRVIMMAGQRLQTADIRLNPADLGPLRVQVSVDDGSVSVNFHAQHALTRDAIEQALPRLRDLLGDNGLALADASVSDQGAPRQEADDSREPAAYGSANVGDGSLVGAAETRSSAARRTTASSLVDLFA